MQKWSCILNKARWAVRAKAIIGRKVALLTPFIGYVFHPSSPSTDVVSSSTTEMGKRGKRKIQPLAICQHTKSPIFTLEIEISVINLFI